MNKFEIKYFENEDVGLKNIEDSRYRVYYCQRGRLSVNFNDELFHLSHGDALILPPDTKHTLYISTPYTVFFVISFDESFIYDEFSKSLRKGKFAPKKVILPPDEIVFFEGSVYKILAEYNNKKDHYDIAIEYSFKCLWTILRRLYVHFDQNTETIKNDVFIKYCISYTDAHCIDNITLSDIVKLSTMSRVVFCSLFKKETGLSFNAYLNRKRIQKAIALIKDGKRITEIAYMCGYTEQSTFYRNFVKFTGVSPTKFQERIINAKN